MTVTARLASGVRRVVRDYRLNWIYASPAQHRTIALPPGLAVRSLIPADLDHAMLSGDLQVRKARGYTQTGAAGFVLTDGGQPPLGIVHFANSACYAYDSIWPLRADQLALVDVVMLPTARGQGHAARLIAAATAAALAAGGQVDALCFIWWNHRASLRAFRRAGWRAVGFSVEITTRRGRARRLRLAWESGISRSHQRTPSPRLDQT